MSDHRTLLFVGGGLEALPGLEMARCMGLHVVVSDGNPHAPGRQVAHDFLDASTYDVPASVLAAQQYHQRERPLDGVMCLASDTPVTVSAIAESLGLPGIPVSVARLATDKLAMKQRLERDGIEIPYFSVVSDLSSLKHILADRGYPMVLKPRDSRGARGVVRLTESIDLSWALAVARRQSPTAQVIVEDYLDGPQVSTESIVLGGIAHTPGFSDRNYSELDRFFPYCIENGGDLPSRLTLETQVAVCDLVQRAAASLGIDNWVTKGDIVIHRGRPTVIEMAARLSGGYFCTDEVPLSTGVEPVRAVIQLSLGLPVDPVSLIPQLRKAVCQRYLFPKPGEVLAIDGVAQARALPGIKKVVMTVCPGDVIRPPTDSNAAAGMVLGTGSDRYRAEKRVNAALNAIHIRTGV